MLQVFAARHRLALGLTAVLLVAGGCGELDQAASAQGIDGNDLVSELAAQLSGSAGRTFTARYQLPGGGQATVSQAQNPARTSYTYPGGRLLVSDDAVTLCAKGCKVSEPPRDGALPATAYGAAQKAGLVAPATVVTLLNAAVLDATVTVDPRDTTIAGHHATCVDLSGLQDRRTGRFDMCLTNDGVLGSFTGTLDGRAIDMAMTEYSAKVPDDAFAVTS